MKCGMFRMKIMLIIRAFFSIVCLFIICIIPSAFSNKRIMYAIFGGDKPMNQFARSNFYFIYQNIANLLVWCNLSLNFVPLLNHQ
jgi:hypothetical protein